MEDDSTKDDSMKEITIHDVAYCTNCDRIKREIEKEKVLTSRIINMYNITDEEIEEGYAEHRLDYSHCQYCTTYDFN